MTNGTHTLIDALFQDAYICDSAGDAIARLQFEARASNSQAELIPVRSPLLKESCLVSYPPLTYMLKFSGFADLTSCHQLWFGWERDLTRNTYRVAGAPVFERHAQAKQATPEVSDSLCSRTDFPCSSCVKGPKRCETPRGIPNTEKHQNNKTASKAKVRVAGRR